MNFLKLKDSLNLLLKLIIGNKEAEIIEANQDLEANLENEKKSFQALQVFEIVPFFYKFLILDFLVNK